MVQKNDDRCVSTWTCDYCRSFLKTHGAVQKGKQEDLRARCLLLKKLIYHGLENIISLSKTQLRSMSNELKLPHSADISKDDLIKKTCDVMIGEANDTSECLISSIEIEERDEDAV